MGIQTTRKCKECKGTIILEESNFIETKISEKQFVYYHYECYVTKLINKKRGAVDEVEARKIADGLKEESKRNANDIIAKNHLFKFIERNYDLVVIPSFVFTKFDAIFKGEFKGQSRPIPAEDLLDMWERKWDELCQIAAWKRLEGIHRLNYDIAVILGKSSSYYAWKDRAKSKNEEIKELQKERKINFDLLNSQTIQKKVVEVADYIIEDEEDE